MGIDGIELCNAKPTPSPVKSTNERQDYSSGAGSMQKVVVGFPSQDDFLDSQVASKDYNLPKSFVYTMLNPRSLSLQATVFKWTITILIGIDLLIFVFSTEPNLQSVYETHFSAWEGIISTIFLVEYVARVVTVVESKKYGNLGPFWGRLRYCTTFPAMLDLTATLPFFVDAMADLGLPKLTWLRSFRIARILKTSGFAQASDAVYRVIYYNRQILYVAVLICIEMIILTAVLMYHLRPPDDDEIPEFQSLASTLYVATLLLTGQGGPDPTDLPWYTKSVVLLSGVLSIGMLALPASMLTWGFVAEAERCAKMAYQQAKNGNPIQHENDDWSDSTDSYATDEEYLRIIAKCDDQGPRPEGSNATKMNAQSSGTVEMTTISDSNKIDGDAAAVSRIQSLETIVLEQNEKIDRICAMLESLQSCNKSKQRRK